MTGGPALYYVATWSGFVYTAFVVDVFAPGSASATA